VAEYDENPLTGLQRRFVTRGILPVSRSTLVPRLGSRRKARYSRPRRSSHRLQLRRWLPLGGLMSPSGTTSAVLSCCAPSRTAPLLLPGVLCPRRGLGTGRRGGWVCQGTRTPDMAACGSPPAISARDAN